MFAQEQVSDSKHKKYQRNKFCATCKGILFDRGVHNLTLRLDSLYRKCVAGTPPFSPSICVCVCVLGR